MKKSILLVLILLSMVLLLHSKTYKIVWEQYPPYEYEENNVIKGLDIEILRAIEKAENVKFEFVQVPWERALRMAQTGEADGIISLFKTEERQAFLHFPSEGLAFEKNVIFAKNTYKGDIKTVADLKGKTIGITSGYSYGKTFDDATGFTKDPSTDQETMFKKFVNNRYEMVISNELVGHYMLKSLNAKDYKILSYVADNQMLYIGISKKSVNSKEVLDLINRGLANLKKSGELAKIRAKYLK